MIQERIESLYDHKPASYSELDYELFSEFIGLLNSGTIRACEHREGIWKVNQWIKKGILLGFRMGTLCEQRWGAEKVFFDKHTIMERKFSLSDQIRIVPGGTSIRNGAYIAAGVAIMPPAFVNIGAYVDANSMIDSHALVGSCAQIGKNVHLSAGAMIGGVIEPVGSRPVIIEDDVFVGGNSGIYEGVLVKSKAVIASGTIITSSTPVFDMRSGTYLGKDSDGTFQIPAGAVVVAGSRALKAYPDHHVYCPIIIKYRDEKTDISVLLEQDLRG